MRTLNLALLLLIFSVPVWASPILPEGQDRNGGDESGMAVWADLTEALARFKALPASRDLDLPALEKAAHNAKIVVIDLPLATDISGFTQNGVAANEPKNNLILINRGRWEKVTNPRAREGILLHELLSLLGLESGGFYEYSAEYLRFYQISPLTLANGETKPAEENPSATILYWDRKTSVNAQVFDEKEKKIVTKDFFNGTTNEHSKFVVLKDPTLLKTFVLSFKWNFLNSDSISGAGLSITSRNAEQDGITIMSSTGKFFEFYGKKFETAFTEQEQKQTNIPGGKLLEILRSKQGANLGPEGYQFSADNDDGSRVTTEVYPEAYYEVGKTNGREADRYFAKGLQLHSTDLPLEENDFVKKLPSAIRQAFTTFKALHLEANSAGAAWKACVSTQGNCDALKGAYDTLEAKRENLFLNLMSAADLPLPKTRPIPRPKPRTPPSQGAVPGRRIIKCPLSGPCAALGEYCGYGYSSSGERIQICFMRPGR